MRIGFKLLTSTALGGLFLAGTSASAQVLGDENNEIVVTAQKRSENLQDVSISITAFTSESIDNLGLSDSVDIVSQVPSLNVGTPVGEGNNPSFTLRGVGLNDFNDNNEGPIAIYVDDVYQAALPGLTFQLFDTERVEVLRGPQGTLYGRNATGGIIQFVSKKPTDTVEGYIDAKYSEFDSFKLEGAIGGPLGDYVRLRASLLYNKSDGYVRNTFLNEDANQADSIAGRLQFEFDLGPSTTLNLKGFFSDSNTNAPQYQHQATLGPDGASNLPFCADDVARDVFCYADTDDDNFSGQYDRRGVLDINARGIHATFNHDFGGVQLVNIAAWQRTEKLHQEDTDVGPFPAIEPQFTSEIDAFSNELRLSGDFGRGNWQIGGYYLDTKVESANDLRLSYRGDFINLLDSDPAGFDGALTAFNGPIVNDGTLVPFLEFDVDYTQNTEVFAGFGQFEYELTDTLKFIGGLRYTHESRDFDYINRAPAGAVLNNVVNGVGEANFFSVRPGDVNGFAAALGAGPADVVADGANALSENSVVWKATLNWQPNPDTLLYAGSSRGFKAGGFNAGFLDQTDFIVSDQVEFGSETLDSYEIGVKWTAPSNVIRVNASAFYYDYKDFQALTFQGLSQFITNADATFYGGEIEIGLRPFEGLDAQFAASYLNTDVDGVVSQGAPLNNREAVLAPEFSANGFVRYSQQVGPGDMSSTVSFNYQGSHFFDITNSDISREDGYVVVDARIAYQLDNGLELSVFGKNIFDKEYRVYTFDFTGIAGFNQQFFAKPQWFGAGARYTF